MPTQSVTLQLDENAVKIHRHIPSAERDKINRLFSLFLNQHQQLPDFLSLLMDAIRKEARAVESNGRLDREFEAAAKPRTT